MEGTANQGLNGPQGERGWDLRTGQPRIACLVQILEDIMKIKQTNKLNK